MGAKVSIREVVEALEIMADEMSSYVNVVTGEITTVTHEELRLAEEDEDQDLPDWQRQAVARAKQVLESNDWLQLPGKFQIHEWEIMNRFGQSLPEAAARDAIAAAIRGSGAFRNFKGTIRRLGVEQDWYAYKQRELEEIARGWLADHNLEGDDSGEAADRRATRN